MEKEFNLDEISKKYLKNPWEKASNIDNVSAIKVDSLKETVEEIEELIKERKILSQNFIKESEKMKTSINNFLLENAPKGEDDSEFIRERTDLRKKQIEISEIQLNEQVNCWQDIALLKKELREREKELTEKQTRTEMIAKILGDEE